MRGSRIDIPIIHALPKAEYSHRNHRASAARTTYLRVNSVGILSARFGPRLCSSTTTADQKMTFTRTQRPKLDKTYYSLAHLAELLPVPADQLIESAAEGILELFVRVPDQCGVYCVHVDGVDPDDVQELASRKIRGISPTEIEARPDNLTKAGIEAFVLSQGDCRKLRNEQVIRQRLYAKGLRQIGNWGQEQLPTYPNCFHRVKTLKPEGWRLACYEDQGPALYSRGLGYSKPVGIELSVDKLFATAQAIKSFFDAIDTNVFVSGLIQDGQIVEDRPAYFSKKLNHLLDGSDIFWRTAKPSVDAEFTGRRSRSIEHFKDPDFHAFFEQGEAAEGMVEAAVKFIVPVFARKNSSEAESAASPTRITPELKALMAAAKYFWSSANIRLDVVNTHPRRDAVERYLRYMGFTKDDAGLGATLVRPEGAAKGPPLKRKLTFKPQTIR